MSASNVQVAEHCVIKDQPDAAVCSKSRHATVTVAYTFSYPDRTEPYVFDLPMCEGHSAAMLARVQADIADHLDTPQGS